MLTLVALPWLLAFVNPSWLLTAPGNIDPWIYFGFFTNFADYLRVFGDTYYASRLAWIVPGAIVHQWLPPLTARYVLHIGVFYVAVFAIYFTLRRTVGARAALFVSILIGCYTHFLRAMGWDYVDGAGIAYYAVALACLTAAIDARRRWLALLAAGAAWAGAVHTNIAWVTQAPAIAYYYFVTTRAARGRPLVDWSYALAGAVLVTLLLGVISVANGGTPWFFMPSVRHVLFLSGTPRPYQTGQSAWVEAARILAVPLLVLIATSIHRLARGAHESTLGRLSCDHYVLSCVLVAAPDIAGRALLQNALYLSYPLPGMALALGVLFRDALDRFSPAAFRTIVLVTVIALAVPLVPVVGGHITTAVWWLGVTAAAATLVAVSLAAFWFRRFPGRVAATTFVVCAGAVNAAIKDRQVAFFDVPGRDASYRAIVEAAGAIKALDPDLAARFWYDERAPLGYHYLSVASTRLWGLRLVNARFPELSDQSSGGDAALRAGQRLMLLTSEPAALNQAKTALGARQLGVKQIAAREFASGRVRFSLLLLELQFDREEFAERPLPVSSEAFLDGSTRRGAARVAVDTDQDMVEITTNHSKYDFQLVSRPIPVTPGRRYAVEFDLQIPKGGAGVHVVAVRTQALLGSQYWCQPMPAAQRQRLTFDAAADDASVYIALSNCGSPEAVVSEFAVRGLQVWPYR